jgi:peptidoglycan hydrolase-like protein with peptidoglycan-binding domain
MQGEDVKRLHGELKELGFNIPDAEIAEGDFGQGTEQAVKEFQRKHGLQLSGIVESMGWNGT